MDNLTHSLIGAHMARAGWSRKYGAGTLLYVIVMSNIPDLDFIWAHLFGDALSFMSRRMLTHSVVGLPLLSLFFGWLFHLKYKQIPLKTFFWLGLAASVTHVFFDMANSYGVAVLYPFLSVRYELAWLFIIDIAIWAILLLPLLFSPILKKFMPTERIALGTLIVLTLYVGFCGTGRALSEHLLEKEAAKGAPADFIYAFPEALGPHRFRGVIRRGNAYAFYQVHYLKNHLELVDTVMTDDADADVIALRQTPIGKKMDWFAKAPVWTKLDADTITVSDLRFRSNVIWRKSVPFTFMFRRNASGAFDLQR